MTGAAQRLSASIDRRGWRARIVPIARLADLEKALADPARRGLFNETFFEDCLTRFRYTVSGELPDARSIIVLAVPVPQVRVTFGWKRRSIPVVIPPTYSGYTATSARVRDEIASWLSPDGYRVVAPPVLPLKTLAVRTGLTEYGRNNITYAPGMGSFLQIVAAFSDLEPPDDPWREPKAVARCAKCVACRRACPTEAIRSDRFLLHAERCLTYHNEGGRDFPDYVDPSSHHCLIGCMRCQEVCPENASVIRSFEDRAEFSEEETAALAAGTPLDLLPAPAAAKLASLGLSEEHDRLCRNLSLLLAAPSAATP